MNKMLVLISALLVFPVMAEEDAASIQKDLDDLSIQYEAQIQDMQQRLDALEKESKETGSGKTQSSFNPAISLIFNGRYASFTNEPEDYYLPGYQTGPHAGIGPEGFSIGESELNFSANIDTLFYGWATIALHDDNGELEIDLEEAYIRTLGLGYGTNVKFGRFYSSIGYLNQQHPHVWDFYDAPLIYRGLFGNQLTNDGIQASVVVPTDLYLEFGAELGNGDHYPAAGGSSGIGSWTLYTQFGGDIGISHSWLAGLSHWSAPDIKDRTGGGHDHGDAQEIPSFTGESEISGLQFVYKWAPRGNPEYRNFRLQMEYFYRHEDGDLLLEGSDPLETTSYKGTQDGWYAQGIYQFVPQWSAGLRYDRVNSDNQGSDEAVLDEAGLLSDGHTPQRYSAMVQWQHTEYSRLRFQYNLDQSLPVDDHQVFVQYTFVLGAHGAHQY